MCGESGTAPAGMPQFIEARAVDTIQDCDFDHLQIRVSLFSSAHVDPAILHTAKCTLMFPPRNQNSPPPPLRCPSPPASPHRSFPLHFKNCSHMSEGTPGSNTSRKQHYYLQLTFNFKCIKRDGAIVQGEGGREDRED